MRSRYFLMDGNSIYKLHATHIQFSITSIS